MNKQHIGPIVYLILVSLTTTLAFSFSIAPRDASWINEVENRIRRENWEPNREYIPLMSDSFFLYENGEEEYFYLYSHQDFVSYMKGLTGKINRKLESSTSKEYMDEILTSDRVLAFVHRFPEGFGFLGLYGSFEVAYFILEDKIRENVEGTIIMQDRRAGEYSHYSVWEIADWIL